MSYHSQTKVNAQLVSSKRRPSVTESFQQLYEAVLQVEEELEILEPCTSYAATIHNDIVRSAASLRFWLPRSQRRAAMNSEYKQEAIWEDAKWQTTSLVSELVQASNNESLAGSIRHEYRAISRRVYAMVGELKP